MKARLNTICVSFFEQIPAQVATRTRLLHVTFGIPPVCRPNIELKPSTDHKLLRGHGPPWSQSLTTRIATSEHGCTLRLAVHP
jgi:hypothetical protein